MVVEGVLAATGVVLQTGASQTEVTGVALATTLTKKIGVVAASVTAHVVTTVSVCGCL